MADLNQSILRAVNAWPDSPFLTFFSVALNFLVVKLALAVLVIALAWRPGGGRQAVIRALMAVPIANGITDLLKHYDGMPRPCRQLSALVYHGIGCGNSMGTASAHSANMAAVATAFVFYSRGWGYAWAVVAFLTGLSRMYVGAHYPYQVVLGWGVGIAVGVVICLVAAPKRVSSARGGRNSGENENQSGE